MRNPMADPTCRPLERSGIYGIYLVADVDELRRRWRECVHENAVLSEKLDRVRREGAYR